MPQYIELTQANIPEIGNILKQLRLGKDMSQQVIAQEMKLANQSQVSIIEKNHKTPGLMSMAKYLKAVGGKLAIILE